MTTASLPPAGPALTPAPEPVPGLEQALWALRAYDTTALATVSFAGPHVAGVFFAPERVGSGLRLLLAVLRGSRMQLDIAADPRVAFMCSPGNPTRWVQGAGRAVPVADETEHHRLYLRLLEHAPGARTFVEDLRVTPVILAVERLKVVETDGGPPLLLDFGGSD
ncbi:MAG: pyridoxamine 5'-phosphate oxidase family protein [Candidatus Dormibacteria bacterium]